MTEHPDDPKQPKPGDTGHKPPVDKTKQTKIARQPGKPTMIAPGDEAATPPPKVSADKPAEEEVVAAEPVEEAAEAVPVAEEEVLGGVEEIVEAKPASSGAVAQPVSDVTGAESGAEHVLEDELAEVEMASAPYSGAPSIEEIAEHARQQRDESDDVLGGERGPARARRPAKPGSPGSGEESKEHPSAEAVDDESSAVNLGKTPAKNKKKPSSGVDVVAEALESGVSLEDEAPVSPRRPPSVEFDDILAEEAESVDEPPAKPAKKKAVAEDTEEVAAAMMAEDDEEAVAASAEEDEGVAVPVDEDEGVAVPVDEDRGAATGEDIERLGSPVDEEAPAPPKKKGKAKGKPRDEEEETAVTVPADEEEEAKPKKAKKKAVAPPPVSGPSCLGRLVGAAFFLVLGVLLVVGAIAGVGYLQPALISEIPGSPWAVKSTGPAKVVQPQVQQLSPTEKAFQFIAAGDYDKALEEVKDGTEDTEKAARGQARVLKVLKDRDLLKKGLDKAEKEQIELGLKELREGKNETFAKQIERALNEPGAMATLQGKMKELENAQLSLKKSSEDLKTQQVLAQGLSKKLNEANLKRDEAAKALDDTKAKLTETDKKLAQTDKKLADATKQLADANNQLKDKSKQLDQEEQKSAKLQKDRDDLMKKLTKETFEGLLKAQVIKTVDQKLDAYTGVLSDRTRKDPKELDTILKDAEWILSKESNQEPQARGKALLATGLALRNLGKFDEARKALDEAAKIKADKGATWQAQAKQAQKELTDPRAYYLPQIEKFQAAGNIKAAIAEANAAVKALPGNGKLLAERGLLHLEQARSAKGGVAAAEKLIRDDGEKAAKAPGGAADGAYVLGLLEEELGQFSKAETYFRNAIDAAKMLPKGSGDDGNRYRIALARVLLRDRPAASAPVFDAPAPAPADKKGESQSSNTPAAGYVHPVAALLLTVTISAQPDNEAPEVEKPADVKRIRESVNLAMDILKTGKDKEQGYAILSNAATQAGELLTSKTCQALAEELLANKDKRTQGIGYLLKAHALTKTGRRTEALKDYSKGVELLNPKNNESRDIAKMIDNHPAFQHPDAANRPNPVLAEKHFNYGLQHYWAKRYAEAEAQFKQALDYYDQDARYLYFLGFAQLAQKSNLKRDQGLFSLERGVQLETVGRPSVSEINLSLERVQGELRQLVNLYRNKGPATTP